MLLQDSVERTLFAVVPEFDIRYVVRDCSFLIGNRYDLMGGHEQELSLRVHELFDEPWAGNSIHLDPFSCNPFHVSPRSGEDQPFSDARNRRFASVQSMNCM